MSYGLDNYVDNKVSAPVFFFFFFFLFFLLTILKLDIKKMENVVPSSFYFCIR